MTTTCLCRGHCCRPHARPAHHHEGLAADTTADEPRAMKVYLDNVIVSGKVRGDVDPPEEMAAVRAFVKADEKGQSKSIRLDGRGQNETAHAMI
jgi:hypothetical protein